MPKASAPKVRRFDAILLDLGFENRAEFAAAKRLHPQQLSTYLVRGFGYEPMKRRIAKAIGVERDELERIVANENRIATERRERKAAAS